MGCHHCPWHQPTNPPSPATHNPWATNMIDDEWLVSLLTGKIGELWFRGWLWIQYDRISSSSGTGHMGRGLLNSMPWASQRQMWAYILGDTDGSILTSSSRALHAGWPYVLTPELALTYTEYICVSLPLIIIQKPKNSFVLEFVSLTCLLVCRTLFVLLFCLWGNLDVFFYSS